MPDVPIRLTSNDPEPPVGAVVRDCNGHMWRREAAESNIPGRARDWFPIEADGSFVNDDCETWTRVAGNQGPVDLLVGPVGKPVYVDGEGDVWLLNDDGTLTACQPVPPGDRYADWPFAEVEQLFGGVALVWSPSLGSLLNDES